MKKLILKLICAALCIALMPISGAAVEDAFVSVPAINVPAQAVQGAQAECDCVIMFDGESAVIDGDGAAYSGGKLLISAAGSYLLSGEFSGTVEINVKDDKKTELYLNGVCIEPADGPAINVVKQDKSVRLISCEDSVNLIKDSARTYTEADAWDAAVYSKADLVFEGEGEIYVTSGANKAVHSTDDIKILSGSLFCVSAGTGIHGKDSVSISGGRVCIESASNGIKSTNAEKDGKGFTEISGGEVFISAEGDGIDAETRVLISGGSIIIKTGGGYTASTEQRTEGFGMGGRGGWGGGPGGPGGRGGSGRSAEAQAADTVSQKAVKSGSMLEISGGTLYIDSVDDALHSNGSALVSGGDIYIYAGDDAVHADSVLTVNGGQLEVYSSYEGLEATVINITDGNIRLNASDDGINASGDDKEVTTGTTYSRFGGNGLGELNISGGYIVVISDGDGVDSNNFITMSGGTLLVYGPTQSMNGALDYETSFSYTGGTLLAVGAAGMAESVTSSENAGVIAFSTRSSLRGLLTLTDAEGNELIAFAAPKAYSSCVFVSPNVQSGASYSIYYGGTHQGELLDYVYASGKTEGAELVGSVTAR